MSDNKKLTITTKRAKEYRVIPAEGALGGLTPSQMFQINFYLESPNIPSTVTHELLPDGKLGPQVAHEFDGGEVLRELQCAVLMTPDQAESLANWIMATVKAQTGDQGMSSDFIN
jgi:hypothetical protein